MRYKFQHHDFAFQLYIQLKDSQPAIWRRVIITVKYSFGQLHQVIQTAFSWQGHHLHMFNLSVLTDHGIDIIQFEPRLDDLAPITDSSLNEDEQTLIDYLEVGQSLEYHYDFGDDWIHNILVEGYLIQIKKQKYPACIDGQNHAAFEDVGGVFGYQHVVKVLANAEHEEYKQVKSWLKECYGAAKINKFDPRDFEAKKVKFNMDI